MKKNAEETLTPLAVGVEQAATLIGISKRSMWTLLEKKAIPKKKVLGRTVIRYADLKKFIDKPDKTYDVDEIVRSLKTSLGI